MTIGFDSDARLVQIDAVVDEREEELEWRYRFVGDADWQPYLTTSVRRLDIPVGSRTGELVVEVRTLLPEGVASDWACLPRLFVPDVGADGLNVVRGVTPGACPLESDWRLGRVLKDSFGGNDWYGDSDPYSSGVSAVKSGNVYTYGGSTLTLSGGSVSWNPLHTPTELSDVLLGVKGDVLASGVVARAFDVGMTSDVRFFWAEPAVSPSMPSDVFTGTVTNARFQRLRMRPIGTVDVSFASDEVPDGVGPHLSSPTDWRLVLRLDDGGVDIVLSFPATDTVEPYRLRVTDELDLRRMRSVHEDLRAGKSRSLSLALVRASLWRGGASWGEAFDSAGEYVTGYTGGDASKPYVWPLVGVVPAFTGRGLRVVELKQSERCWASNKLSLWRRLPLVGEVEEVIWGSSSSRRLESGQLPLDSWGFGYVSSTQTRDRGGVVWATTLDASGYGDVKVYGFKASRLRPKGVQVGDLVEDVWRVNEDAHYGLGDPGRDGRLSVFNYHDQEGSSDLTVGGFGQWRFFVGGTFSGGTGVNAGLSWSRIQEADYLELGADDSRGLPALPIGELEVGDYVVYEVGDRQWARFDVVDAVRSVTGGWRVPVKLGAVTGRDLLVSLPDVPGPVVASFDTKLAAGLGSDIIGPRGAAGQWTFAGTLGGRAEVTWGQFHHSTGLGVGLILRYTRSQFEAMRGYVGVGDVLEFKDSAASAEFLVTGVSEVVFANTFTFMLLGVGAHPRDDLVISFTTAKTVTYYKRARFLFSTPRPPQPQQQVPQRYPYYNFQRHDFTQGGGHVDGAYAFYDSAAVSASSMIAPGVGQFVDVVKAKTLEVSPTNRSGQEQPAWSKLIARSGSTAGDLILFEVNRQQWVAWEVVSKELGGTVTRPFFRYQLGLLSYDARGGFDLPAENATVDVTFRVGQVGEPPPQLILDLSPIGEKSKAGVFDVTGSLSGAVVPARQNWVWSIVLGSTVASVSGTTRTGRVTLLPTTETLNVRVKARVTFPLGEADPVQAFEQFRYIKGPDLDVTITGAKTGAPGSVVSLRSTASGGGTGAAVREWSVQNGVASSTSAANVDITLGNSGTTVVTLKWTQGGKTATKEHTIAIVGLDADLVLSTDQGSYGGTVRASIENVRGGGDTTTYLWSGGLVTYDSTTARVVVITLPVGDESDAVNIRCVVTSGGASKTLNATVYLSRAGVFGLTLTASKAEVNALSTVAADRTVVFSASYDNPSTLAAVELQRYKVGKGVWEKAILSDRLPNLAANYSALNQSSPWSVTHVFPWASNAIDTRWRVVYKKEASDEFDSRNSDGVVVSVVQDEGG